MHGNKTFKLVLACNYGRFTCKLIRQTEQADIVYTNTGNRGAYIDLTDTNHEAITATYILSHGNTS